MVEIKLYYAEIKSLHFFTQSIDLNSTNIQAKLIYNLIKPVIKKIHTRLDNRIENGQKTIKPVKVKFNDQEAAALFLWIISFMDVDMDNFDKNVFNKVRNNIHQKFV